MGFLWVAGITVAAASTEGARSLLDDGGDGIVAVHADADIQVIAGVVTAVVTSRFRNEGAEWVDATYTHALPADARVEALDVSVAGCVVGDGFSVEGASSVYTAVLDVPPGAEIDVRLEMVLEPTFAEGSYRIDLPLIDSAQDIDSEVTIALVEGVRVRGLASETHGMAIRSLWTESPRAFAVGPYEDRLALTWTLEKDAAAGRAVATVDRGEPVVWVALEPPASAGSWEALSVEMGEGVWAPVGSFPGEPLRLVAPKNGETVRVRGQFGQRAFDLDIPLIEAPLFRLPPLAAITIRPWSTARASRPARPTPAMPRSGNGVVQVALHDNRRLLAYCFERHRREAPALEGRLELDLVIVGGRVTWADVTYNGTGHEAIETCVETTVRRIAFPAEVSMFVRMPMLFSTR